MFQSLIVGFGRAGKQLHLRCLRQAQELDGNNTIFDSRIGVVDPRLGNADPPHDKSVRMFTNLAAVDGFNPTSTVVHICTPPTVRVDIIRSVSELGYTRMIVEKPLATSMRDVQVIQQLAKERHLDILVIAVWLSSALTKELKTLIESARYGPLEHLLIEQHKPRFLRTLRDPGHMTAFDVELPHQLALAMHLGGEPIEVIEAACTDMRIGRRTVPYMGTARMVIRHNSGLESVLFSDLTAKTRQRVVQLSFLHQTVNGYFPTSESVHYSQLARHNSGNHLLEARQLEDDPLTACFSEYYAYFERGGPRPVSDLRFNSILVSAMTRAKTLTGIPTPIESNSRQLVE